MANRCTFGNHGSCSGCNSFVNSSQADHAHIWSGGRYKDGLLCRECWLIIAIASRTVLSAINKCGINIETANNLRDVLSARVLIGVQGDLYDAQAGAN